MVPAGDRASSSSAGPVLGRRAEPDARHISDLVRFAHHALQRHQGREGPTGDPVEEPLQGAEFVDGQRRCVPEQGPDELSGRRHRQVPGWMARAAPRVTEREPAERTEEARGEGGDVDDRDGPRSGLHLGPVRHDHAQRVPRPVRGIAPGSERSLGVHRHAIAVGRTGGRLRYECSTVEASSPRTGGPDRGRGADGPEGEDLG